jgi:hypothetical protein
MIGASHLRRPDQQILLVQLRSDTYGVSLRQFKARTVAVRDSASFAIAAFSSGVNSYI